MSEPKSTNQVLNSKEAIAIVSALLESSNLISDWASLNSFKKSISEAFLMAKVSKEGLLLEVNDHFQKAIGFEEKELLGRPISTLNSNLVPLDLAINLWDEISQGKVWRGEISKTKKDGNLLWVRATIIPVLIDNDIDHFIGIYLDISKRIKIENDLELFLGMINQSNDAIQVADEMGSLQYVNLRSTENLGYTREELIGRKVWEFEKIFNDLDDWKNHVAAVKASSNGMLVDGYNTRKDGSIFPVEVNVKHMVLNDKGYIVGILRDVSDRRNSQLELQKSQQLLNEAQRIAKFTSFELLPGSSTLEFSENAWRVLGFEKESSFSLDSLPEILHPEDRISLSTQWIKVTQEGGLIDQEFRIYTQKGNLNYLKLILRVYQSEDGKQNRAIGTIQNITDEVLVRKQLEKRTKELEYKNSELDQFAQIVSHDLKSPLRAIHNLSNWIEEGLPELSPENAKNLDLLKRRVERMENLINGILNYSSAGKLKMSREFEAGLVVADLLDSIKMSFPKLKTKQNITSLLNCDQTAFEQVMGNLISNAAKHNNSLNPEVEISSEEDKHSVTFFIKDNGPGIEPVYHNKIFKMFQTLLPRDTVENTGVGLAIVKKLCDELNWSISLKSELKIGSVFILNIPKVSDSD